MAGDLIPPPSPAGRPAPDAMAGVRASDEPPPAPDRPEPEPPGETPFRTRFGFVWGVLAGVAVCVAAVTGALAVTADNDRGPALAKDWSAWKPSTSRMLDGAVEIAAHVARQYRLDAGDQLTTVQAGPMRYGPEPVGVAIRPRGGELQVLDGDAVLYVVNLLDENDKSTSTRTRDRLVLRQALELALYSFRYLDDVTMVAVELPAGETEQETKLSRALFYRPGDLLPQLKAPLAATLAPKTPRPDTLSRDEVNRIDSLALRHRFDISIAPLEPDLRYLVLSEPAIVDGS